MLNLSDITSKFRLFTVFMFVYVKNTEVLSTFLIYLNKKFVVSGIIYHHKTKIK
jgi:hypothetical protein